MKLLIISFLTILASTCNKSKLSGADEIVFGSSHGFCMGDCVQMFKLSKGNLYADNMNKLEETYTFSDETLPSEKERIAESLAEQMPAFLMENPNQRFGCPDCADQGALHLQVMKDDTVISWTFDANIASNPKEVRPFVTALRDAVEALK